VVKVGPVAVEEAQGTEDVGPVKVKAGLEDLAFEGV